MKYIDAGVAFLKGKKTYLVGALMISYAILGVHFGIHDGDAANKLVFEALGLMALRNGVTTELGKSLVSKAKK